MDGTRVPGSRSCADAEHVSGNKLPGEHEAMHGEPNQKAAYAAAVAAGMSIAVAFMAAQAGKFEIATLLGRRSWRHLRLLPPLARLA